MFPNPWHIIEKHCITTLGPQKVKAPTVAWIGTVPNVFSTKHGCACRTFSSFQNLLTGKADTAPSSSVSDSASVQSYRKTSRRYIYVQHCGKHIFRLQQGIANVNLEEQSKSLDTENASHTIQDIGEPYFVRQPSVQKIGFHHPSGEAYPPQGRKDGVSQGTYDGVPQDLGVNWRPPPYPSGSWELSFYGCHYCDSAGTCFTFFRP